MLSPISFDERFRVRPKSRIFCLPVAGQDDAAPGPIAVDDAGGMGFFL